MEKLDLAILALVTAEAVGTPSPTATALPWKPMRALAQIDKVARGGLV